MNKDQVKGKAKQIKGTLKKETGKLTGNKSLEREGARENLSGDIQQGYGNIRQDVKGSI